MRHISTDLRAYLQLFTPEEQLLEVDQWRNDIIKNINPNHIFKRRYNKIQQLTKLKHDILLNLMQTIINDCSIK